MTTEVARLYFRRHRGRQSLEAQAPCAAHVRGPARQKAVIGTFAR